MVYYGGFFLWQTPLAGQRTLAMKQNGSRQTANDQQRLCEE
jgi:hypothetical protein